MKFPQCFLCVSIFAIAYAVFVCSASDVIFIEPIRILFFFSFRFSVRVSPFFFIHSVFFIIANAGEDVVAVDVNETEKFAFEYIMLAHGVECDGCSRRTEQHIL